MRLDADFDLDRLWLLLAALPAHLAEYETDEALHTIQNGLKLQLNGLISSLDESLSDKLQINPMRGRSGRSWGRQGESMAAKKGVILARERSCMDQP